MAASQGKARGILMWKLRMKIGAAIVRANAMLLMDRVARLIRGSPRRSVGSFEGGTQPRLPMLTGCSGTRPLDGRRRDRGLGFLSFLS